MSKKTEEQFKQILEAINSMNEKYADSLGSVVQSLSDIVKTQQEDIKSLKVAQSHQSDIITEQSTEIKSLKSRVSLYEARIERLERGQQMQNEEILELGSRSMRDNLVFSNIPEAQNEDCRSIIKEFIKDTMQVEDDIQIDRAHRMGGKRNDGTPRQLVVKFSNTDSKVKVQKAGGKLDKTGKYMNEQFPPEIENRRRRLLKVKKAKLAEDENAKCKLVVDKLFVNNVQHIDQDDQSRMNIFSSDDMHAATQVQVEHSDMKVEGGSSFQGHAAKIDDADDIRPTLLKVYENKLVAQATHNVYAYRYRDGNNQVHEVSNDDKERGAGHQLLQLLQERNLEDVMVIGTRWFGGKEIGKVRFDIYKEMVGEALDKLVI